MYKINFLNCQKKILHRGAFAMTVKSKGKQVDGNEAIDDDAVDFLRDYDKDEAFGGKGLRDPINTIQV